AHKHLARVWRLADACVQAGGAGAEAAPAGGSEAPAPGSPELDLARASARAIADVTAGIEGFAFNTAVAKLYGFTNAIAKSKASPTARGAALRIMAQLMAPMTPHLAEELWSMLGGQDLITASRWPKADPALLVEDTVTLPIQINGKRRSELQVAKDLDKSEIEARALADPAVQKALDGKTPKKLIVVPGRIVNVVV
ncbi:MAG: class I tRNA ligase family protein, partial [Mangrovicoccus sp.]|nr:class I tRNA ligase family protein [Mangrovicoccus sp.]